MSATKYTAPVFQSGAALLTVIDPRKDLLATAKWMAEGSDGTCGPKNFMATRSRLWLKSTREQIAEYVGLTIEQLCAVTGVTGRLKWSPRGFSNETGTRWITSRYTAEMAQRNAQFWCTGNSGGDGWWEIIDAESDASALRIAILRDLVLFFTTGMSDIFPLPAKRV